MGLTSDRGPSFFALLAQQGEKLVDASALRREILAADPEDRPTMRDRLHDIEPGNAAASIFEFRMDSADPAIMMPEVGRSVVHREGVQLIRDWINAQPGSCGSAAGES